MALLWVSLLCLGAPVSVQPVFAVAASAIVPANSASEPKITRHPLNQITYVGGEITLSVSASGMEPLSYQWRFNGEDIVGADAATLTLSNITPAHAGGYSVAVSNNAGSDVSRIGHVSVATKPDAPRLYSVCPRGPVPGRMILRDAVFSGARFTAVGDRGVVVTSDDGSSWAAQDSGLGTRLAGVAAGNGLRVAVGDEGYIVTSSDNLTWAFRESGTRLSLNGAAFGAGKFVVVGASGMVLTSANGLLWERAHSAKAASWKSVTFANGLFVAVGTGGAIMTSADGVKWTARRSGASRTLTRVTFGGGIFLALGSAGTLLTSTDGIAWQKHSLQTKNTLTAACYGNGVYVVAAVPAASSDLASPAAGEVWGSQDGGQTWSPIGTPDFGTTAWANLYGAASNGSLLVQLGAEAIYTSTDGVSWQRRGASIDSLGLYDYNLIGSMVAADGSYLAVGPRFTISGPDVGFAYTSSDGFNWVQQQIPSVPTGSGARVCYGNGVYSAYFDGGNNADKGFYSSVDGLTWTKRLATLVYNGTDYDPHALYLAGGFFNGQFLYVGEDSAGGTTGSIARSVDGVSWTVQRLGSHRLNSIAYGAGLFVAVGTGGIIYTSPDGIAWSARLSGTTEGITMVAFCGGRFFAKTGVYSATTASQYGALVSNDGISWQKIRLPFRNYNTNFTVESTLGGLGDRYLFFGLDPKNRVNLFESKDSVAWRPLRRELHPLSAARLISLDGRLFGVGLGATFPNTGIPIVAVEVLARPAIRAMPAK